MLSLRFVFLTALSLTAFAGNSLLCRLALRDAAIDPASFTAIRLASGAITLWLIVKFRYPEVTARGNWISASALYLYAAGFSVAYLSLSAGTGALLLFGAVQLTMISHGLWCGERLRTTQIVGFLCAVSGLIYFLWPGVSAPSFFGSLLMAGAGVSWGVYSLRGRGVGNASVVTAGNFMRAAPVALLASGATLQDASWSMHGVAFALTSGVVTSGLGYAIWYTALPHLTRTTAATVQLSVPIITAVAAGLLLGETITQRLTVASIAILGGIALVVLAPAQR